jgi:hypothetical protein
VNRRITVSVVACLSISHAHAAELPRESIAGTYEILICRNSCPDAGDKNVLLKGRVVLFSTDLKQSDVARFPSSRYRGQAPNGCFSLDKRPDIEYSGYAGIDKVGLTAWSIEGNELLFQLYRSADAGYKVTAQLTQTGFAGSGKSWGAGVAAPVGVEPDRIVARRIRVADVSECGLPA